jgi:hypothetical protein
MPVKFSKLETVRYVKDREPDCAGVFLCLVQLDDTELTEDVVLEFDGQQWWRVDTPFLRDVFGFIGPIERLGVRFMQERRRKEDLPHHGHGSEGSVFDV